MALFPLSDLHEELRVLLGDGGDPVAGYDYTVEQLNAYLRVAARRSSCLTINASDPSKLNAEPVNMDTRAWLVTKAAYLKAGGETPESWRTRAIGHTIDAASRRDTLVFLENLLTDLDASGNVCGVAGATGRSGLFAGASDWVTYVTAGCPWADPEVLTHSICPCV